MQRDQEEVSGDGTPRVKSWQALLVGPAIYLAGIVTIRLLEIGHVADGAIVFALAVGMCSTMVLLAAE